MDARSWNFRAASCIGKEAFSTPQLAAKVHRRRMSRGRIRSERKKQKPYHCQVCGYFHIGTQAKSSHHTTSSRRRFRVYQMEDEESMA